MRKPQAATCGFQFTVLCGEHSDNTKTDGTRQATFFRPVLP